jgi:hypothetical protein
MRITLRVGDRPTLDVELHVGPFLDRVEIQARPTGVTSTEYQVQGIVGRTQVEQLPLNGRNVLDLARLEPGVTVESVANPGAFANNYQRVSVAGASYLQTRVAVDGGAVEDRINGGTSHNFSQEAVQEFQIGTFNLDVATGATGVGAINVVTKRGTNATKGAAFAYYRDHHLAAYPALRRNPATPDPYFARRQLGASGGGKLKTDRMFWFASAERHSQDGLLAVTNNHPIFSKLDVLYPSPLDALLVNARVDGSLQSRHQWFVRFSRDDNQSIAPFSAAVTMPSNWQRSQNLAHQVVAGVNSTVSSSIVNELVVAAGALNNELSAVSDEQCPEARACMGLGSPELLVFDAPALRIGYFASVPKRLRQRTLTLTNNLTWQRGSHRLRVGGSWEHLSLVSRHEFYREPQLTLWGPTDLLRSPVWRPLYDSLPASLRDPAAPPPTYADLLELPLRSFIVGLGDPLQPGRYNHDDASHPDVVRAYAQDVWGVGPRVTFAYGVSYLGRTNIFNRDLPRPEYLSPLFDGNLSPPSRGRHVLDPSAGAVWRLAESTAVRSGVGVYRDRADFFVPYLERGQLGPTGNQRVAVDGSVAGITFLSMPTGFRGRDLLPLLPGIRATLDGKFGDGSDPSVRAVEVLKQGDRIFAPDHTVPRTLHASAGVQHEFTPGVTVSADVVWRRTSAIGAFQYVAQIDRNRFNRPRVLGVNPDSGEVSFVRDPVIRQCTAAETQSLNPLDQCSNGAINTYSSGASSRYRGLHVRLDARLGRDLQLTSSYALGSQAGFVEFTDHANFESGSGPLATDRRHRLTVSAVYELPDYSGGRRWLRALCEGWTFALISQTDSPTPLGTILTGLDLDGDGISRTLLPGAAQHNSLGRDLTEVELQALVASYNAGVDASSGRVTQADGSVALVRPRTPFNQIISPIVLPETFASGDSFITQDVRITRRLQAASRVRVLLVGEVFNLFNVANLTGYSSVLNQVNYGQPSGRAGQVFGSGGARAIQFAARLEF